MAEASLHSIQTKGGTSNKYRDLRLDRVSDRLRYMIIVRDTSPIGYKLKTQDFEQTTCYHPSNVQIKWKSYHQPLALGLNLVAATLTLNLM